MLAFDGAANVKWLSKSSAIKVIAMRCGGVNLENGTMWGDFGNQLPTYGMYPEFAMFNGV